MILVDINLLLQQLNGVTQVGLPWASLLGFLRLVTNPQVFGQPKTMAAAWRQVLAWLDCDPVWVPQPTERHAEVLGQFLALPGVRGKLVPDAHLAALAMEHSLFPGLRWINPLVA